VIEIYGQVSMQIKCNGIFTWYTLLACHIYQCIVCFSLEACFIIIPGHPFLYRSRCYLRLLTLCG